MSLDLAPDLRPLTSIDVLLEGFASAERPAALAQIGLEHEKLVFPLGEAGPVAYEGPRGIGALLAQIERRGYQPFREAPGLPVIALQKGAATVSLEPGGQFEFSGSPGRTASQVHQEHLAHLGDAVAAASELGLGFATLGYRPFGVPALMPWMPKSRYGAMKKTLGARGALALDMMLMTATGQVSLDWSSEADCALKVTAASRISPLLIALFANSPLVNGAASGFKSYRSHVWTQVDPSRCGLQSFMLDGSFSYRAYVAWALEAPLLFLRRNGGYATPPLTFRQLLDKGFEGRPAVQADWVDHLSTLFPEVRIKRVLEIRSADCVSVELTAGLAALMRGLLYSPQALEATAALLPVRTLPAYDELANVARRQGLSGVWGKRRLAEWAVDLVAIARRGLAALGDGDATLLDPLAALAASGRSPADAVLAKWQEQPSPAALLAANRLAPPA